MQDFSLIEKVKILMDIVASSPLFLFCFILSLVILILYIISIKNDKNINRWIFISAWLILAIIVIISYYKTIISITDRVFDEIFQALYFPNLVIYIAILSISNFIFFYSLFNKKLDRINRIVNFSMTLLTDVLLLFIIDTIQNNNVDVYNDLSIYSNPNLLVLLQLTTSIFVIWILVVLLLSAHKKLKKYDKKDQAKLPEIVFDNI